jgi:uncharacterized pyridoxamine 5'-phosphate oxidase family protein
MSLKEPKTEIDARYSAANATPTPWADAREKLAAAEIYWLSTVRPDGRPHVTPLIAIWLDESLYFCTGAHERKARNLAKNANCVITTGCNAINEGLDLVIEGEAVVVRDESVLQRLVELYKTTYDWDFTVRDGTLVGGGDHAAVVYAVTPATGFGFGKTVPSQTRWLF